MERSLQFCTVWTGGLLVKLVGPSTRLGMSGEQKKPPSKRALTAQLKTQKREEKVIARQKPVTSASLGTGLALRAYESYLRTGR